MAQITQINSKTLHQPLNTKCTLDTNQLRRGNSKQAANNGFLGGGFKHFFFSPLTGEDEPNLTCAYFSNGLVQPPNK